MCECFHHKLTQCLIFPNKVVAFSFAEEYFREKKKVTREGQRKKKIVNYILRIYYMNNTCTCTLYTLSHTNLSNLLSSCAEVIPWSTVTCTSSSIIGGWSWDSSLLLSSNNSLSFNWPLWKQMMSYTCTCSMGYTINAPL